MWNGTFWIRVQPDESSLEQRGVQPEEKVEFFLDRRRVGVTGVVLAAVAGVLLTHVPIDVPAVGSLDQALKQLAITTLLWQIFSYGTVVVILSIGRRGVDVMLLRSMVVAFLMGVAFLALTPLGAIVTGGTWVLWLLAFGLVWVVIVGPVFAVWATLMNLVWYRDTHSMRPQLGFLSPG